VGYYRPVEGPSSTGVDIASSIVSTFAQRIWIITQYDQSKISLDRFSRIAEGAGTVIANVNHMPRCFSSPIILLCILLAACGTARARTFPLDKVEIGSNEFFGTVSYDVEKAYAGNHNLLLTISLNTKAGKDLELIRCESPEQAKIMFTEISRTAFFDSATGLHKNEYTYRADIAETAEPRIYLVPLTFSYPDEKNTNRIFWLYVGVRNKGKLGVVADQVGTNEFLTGSYNTFRLELENNFPDYPVNVRSITVKSDPPGVVENLTAAQNLTIDPLQRGSIELNLKASSMSFSNLLSGFSDSTRLIVNITYDDTFGRVITDLTYPVKIRVRPRDRVLVLAMIIGVVAGAIIKLYLQRLQQKGVITKREVLIAVGVTSIIGLVVSFIAVVGRIKIIAFDQMGSYDNPAVIFVISLAGAVGGAQLFSMLVKSGPPGAQT